MAELIQSVIASLLLKEVSDPRLKFASITHVDLSPDGKRALIFFSLMDPTEDNVKLANTAFQSAAGFIRLHLSRQTELRHTPQLHFHYDASLIAAEKVTRLINDAK